MRRFAINCLISRPIEILRNVCVRPILDYFTPNSEYKLEDFVMRSHTALNIASDRVLAKYGMPCGKALGQLRQIEIAALAYQNFPEPKVQFIQFIES